MNYDNVKIDIKDLSVMFGMPAGRDLHPRTVVSMIYTFLKCAQMGIPCEPGIVAHGSIITKSRDEVLDMFLASKAKKLFWVDSDMVWNPDDFIRLLALSKVVSVVGATYPAKVDGPTTFYVKYDTLEIGDYGLIEVLGMGLGFTVIDREIAEALASKAPRVFDELGGKEYASVFRVDSIDGKLRGEDMAFFADIRALGHKVWLDPMVDLVHVGVKQYSGSIRDALKLS
jgi:hypothetical protein